MVVQEDRNLVMAGASSLDLDRDDGLEAAYLAIADHRPVPLGSYLLRRGRGENSCWTYQAVVHDFEGRPTCRAGNVRRSLTAILRDGVKRGMTSLTVEPLGVWHTRGLTHEEMVEAFEAAILELSVDIASPLRVTLLLDDMEDLEEVSHLFRSHLLRKAMRRFRTVDGGAALIEVQQRGLRLHFRYVPGSLSGYSITCIDRPY